MTVSLDSSLIGKTLDFETNAPQILGSRIKGAKLLGILDPATAKVLGVDISALHIQVYPYLPAGTPDNSSKYNYCKFMLSDGTVQVLGIPWIKESSISITVTTNLSVLIKNCSHEDVEEVRRALMASGFEDFTIEVKA